MTRRKGIAIGIAAIVLLVACAACLAYCKPAGQAGGAGRPVLDVLHDDGYEGTLDDWAESLTDEQKAAIDIAYESSVADGFSGSKEEWLSKGPTARRDGNGDLVVTLPDGGEFTVTNRAGDASGKIDEEPGAKSESGAASSTSAASAPGASGSDRAADPEDGPSAADSPQSESPESDHGNVGGETDRKPPADGTATLAVDDVRAHAGDDNVLVSVRVENNPGILGLTLSLSYDESALTLEGAESGDALRDELTFTHSRMYESGCVFTWDGVELPPGGAKDGAVLNLYFKVAGDAARGNYPVVVHGGDTAFAGNLEKIELAVQNGSVTIE